MQRGQIGFSQRPQRKYVSTPGSAAQRHGPRSTGADVAGGVAGIETSGLAGSVTGSMLARSSQGRIGRDAPLIALARATQDALGRRDHCRRLDQVNTGSGRAAGRSPERVASVDARRTGQRLADDGVPRRVERVRPPGALVGRAEDRDDWRQLVLRQVEQSTVID
jgi:hypothetical protein